MIRVIIAACLAFIIFLTIHVIDFHFFVPMEKVNALLWTAIVGALIFITLCFLLPAESWFCSKLHIREHVLQYWLLPCFGLVFYSLLFLGYLEFYFTADRSITFRMLMLINEEPSHSITRAKMFKLYDIPGIIDKRFDDLCYGGYLHAHNGNYYLTYKGNLTLQIYRTAINYLHLHTGKKLDKNEVI